MIVPTKQRKAENAWSLWWFNGFVACDHLARAHNAREWLLSGERAVAPLLWAVNLSVFRPLGTVVTMPVRAAEQVPIGIERSVIVEEILPLNFANSRQIPSS